MNDKNQFRREKGKESDKQKTWNKMVAINPNIISNYWIQILSVIITINVNWLMTPLKDKDLRILC